MNKFADIFESNGVPYPMSVLNVDRDVTTKFGVSTVILLNHEGEEYKWFVDDEKFSRTFPTDVFSGDEITVTKKQHPKNATWSFYQTQITKRSENASTPQKRETLKAESSKEREVTQYRMGLAGVSQSLISSGKYDLANADQQKAMQEKAVEITRWIRSEAEKMYEEDNVKDEVEEAFDEVNKA